MHSLSYEIDWIYLNWDDLRFFLALARTRTVSAAGRELEVKHTTVSRRIKALEQGLGTRLFDHLPDGYALTPAGENLFQNALLMEEQAQAVGRQVFGLDEQLEGHLVLTAAHDVWIFRRRLSPQPEIPPMNVPLASPCRVLAQHVAPWSHPRRSS